MIEQALVTHLNPLFKGEVYFQVAPNKAKLPRAVYAVISQVAGFTLAGYDGYLPTSIQLDCWANTASEALDYANRAFTALVTDNKGDFTVSAAQRLADSFDETLMIYACRWEYRLETE